MDGKSWRYREFELDRSSFSLRRAGVLVKLDPKPLELLFLLAERDGDLVTHDEALTHVWGQDVFIDGESALYTAIKKIRQALGDPKIVQTVSRRGYRLQTPDAAQPATRDTPPTTERLAVLPLANLSGDPAQEYFSDGLTEELIATLAKLFGKELGVIARTSVMRFKGVSRPIEEIARDLGVDYLVEGSVRRSDNRVRIAVQLLRAADATCIWTETFERSGEDVFQLQSEIALATAHAVRGKLGGSVANFRSVDTEVHDTYLRARHLWAQRTRPSVEAAIRHFRETLALDPDFAPAYAGLSCCFAILPISGNQRSAECFPQAQQLAEKALSLDPAQGEAHIALGLVHFWYRRDWKTARGHFTQAAALNPSDSQAPMFLAHIDSVLQNHDRALSTLANARKLDPLSAILGTHEGHFLYNAQRSAEALRPLARVIELNPQFWIAHLMHGKALAACGQTSAALAAFARAQRLGGGNTEGLSFRAHTLAAEGRQQQGRTALGQLRKLQKTQDVPPLHLGLALLGLGEREEALQALEQGFVEHDVRLIFLNVERRWRALAGTGEFEAILERSGLLNPG